MSVEVGVLALYVVPLALTIHLVGRVSTDTSKPAGGDEALFGAPLAAAAALAQRLNPIACCGRCTIAGAATGEIFLRC